MKCKVCNENLVIGSGKLESDINTTEVNCKQVFFCVNPDCSNYAGKDLNDSSAKVADSITQKVGGEDGA